MTRSVNRARSSAACIGIDVQGDAVVAVQAQRSRGRIVYSTLSPGDAASAAARGAAVALSCRESFTRWLETPFDRVSKAAKVLPTVLDIQLPFALEECLYQFVETRKVPGKGVRALAAVVRVETIEKKLAALRERDIDPVIVDHEGLALWSQALREMTLPKSPSALHVIVCLGVERSTLVVGKGHEYVSSHALPSAEPSQILRLLDAQFASAPTEVRWIWAGPRAADASFTAALHARLSGSRPGVSATPQDPARFLARALAVRARMPEPLLCNLRRGAYRHPLLLARDRRREAGALAVVLLSGLLLCGLSGWTQACIAREKNRQSAVLRQLTRRLAGYDTGAARGEQALRTVNDAVRKRQDTLRPFHDAFEPSLTGVVGQILDIGRQCDLRFETIILARDQVQIAGTARDWRRVEALLAYVKALGFAAKLDRKEPLDDETIPFLIAAESRS